jgi:integrase
MSKTELDLALLARRTKEIDLLPKVKIFLDSIARNSLKSYLLILISAGMRAVEAAAIRLKDIDFSASPTKIRVRKEYAIFQQCLIQE